MVLLTQRAFCKQSTRLAPYLIVAPIGSTKEATLLETPTFIWTVLSVTGRVAPEELVENAINTGSRMIAKWIRAMQNAAKAPCRIGS